MPLETLRLTRKPMAPMRKAERCMELRDLATGWLDGEGVPPPSDLLELVGDWLETHQHKGLQQPRLYPTPQGGVEAEWRIGRVELSIEFDPDNGLAEWHQLDLDSDNKLDPDSDNKLDPDSDNKLDPDSDDKVDPKSDE